MRTITITTILLLFFTTAFGQTKFQKDFVYYWQTVDENFVYFNKQHTNWQKIKTLYQPAVDAINNATDFIHLLEKVKND